jgi:hypothetical protein
MEGIRFYNREGDVESKQILNSDATVDENLDKQSGTSRAESFKNAYVDSVKKILDMGGRSHSSLSDTRSRLACS